MRKWLWQVGGMAAGGTVGWEAHDVGFGVLVAAILGAAVWAARAGFPSGGLGDPGALRDRDCPCAFCRDMAFETAL